MYPSLDIFGRQVGTYPLAFILGLFACVLLGLYLGKIRRFKYYEDILLILLVAGAGILIGGHLLYAVTRCFATVKILTTVEGLSTVETIGVILATFGGSVFYGGLIGSLVALLIYTKHAKTINRPDTFDIYAVCIPLFHCFGRIGCFFGGCCFGIECKIGFITNSNSLNPVINGVRRFPVQLLEAFLNLCIFALILTLFKKEKLRGNLILVYLFIYGIVRFCTEFLRGDEIRGRVLCFSTSQWISLALIAFVVIRVLYLRNKKTTDPATE